MKRKTNMGLSLSLLISISVAMLASATAQDFPEMVGIPAGSFLMGDNHYIGFDDEMPLHTVSLNAYQIGRTEVTVAQWKYYCGQNDLEMPPAPPWGWQEGHPVVNILWSEAVDYCNWLSRTTGDAYRLPTEAEWEYAAKGGPEGKSYKYSGAQWIDTVAWYSENANKTTHPVARKMPNELGLYDMAGNAWEWCLDQGDRVYTAKPMDNPLETGDSNSRVVKGGSYAHNSSVCRSAYRASMSIANRRMQTGLRVVRETNSAQVVKNTIK